MDLLNCLLDMSLNAFGKSGGIPTTASGVSLLGSLLYAQYENEAPDVWDLFMGGMDLEEAMLAPDIYMADKLDMTLEEFQAFQDSKHYEPSLDEVARWKENHPDPLDVLVDSVMERTKGQ